MPIHMYTAAESEARAVYKNNYLLMSINFLWPVFIQEASIEENTVKARE